MFWTLMWSERSWQLLRTYSSTVKVVSIGTELEFSLPNLEFEEFPSRPLPTIIMINRIVLPPSFLMLSYATTSVFGPDAKSEFSRKAMNHQKCEKLIMLSCQKNLTVKRHYFWKGLVSHPSCPKVATPKSNALLLLLLSQPKMKEVMHWPSRWLSLSMIGSNHGSPLKKSSVLRNFSMKATLPKLIETDTRARIAKTTKVTIRSLWKSGTPTSTGLPRPTRQIGSLMVSGPSLLATLLMTNSDGAFSYKLFYCSKNKSWFSCRNRTSSYISEDYMQHAATRTSRLYFNSY